MEFNEKLREALRDVGLSQAEYSRRSGKPLRTVQNWCGGKNIPAVYTQNAVLTEVAKLGKVKDK